MAVLSETERAAAWRDCMDAMSKAAENCGITKVQLRAAIDAADQWADDNSASFNSALPTAARNTLTAKQKARILMLVVARRFGVS